MTIELIEMTGDDTPWYIVKVDGKEVPCRSGNYEDAEKLYNSIIQDPSYLTSREVLLQETIIN